MAELLREGVIRVVAGLGVFEREAEENGWARPRVIAHEGVPRRFARYALTAGYNQAINTRQFGVEDQGWVAWFTIAARLGRPITVYGDGKQVRDVLWIDDLLDLYGSAIERARELRGAVYNVGGGPENTLSLLELLDFLREETGAEPEVVFDDWRPGDQRVFVAEVSKAERELGWKPTVAPREGVRRLAAWVDESRELLRDVLG